MKLILTKICSPLIKIGQIRFFLIGFVIFGCVGVGVHVHASMLETKTHLHCEFDKNLFKSSYNSDGDGGFDEYSIDSFGSTRSEDLSYPSEMTVNIENEKFGNSIYFKYASGKIAEFKKIQINGFDSSQEYIEIKIIEDIQTGWFGKRWGNVYKISIEKKSSFAKLVVYTSKGTWRGSITGGCKGLNIIDARNRKPKENSLQISKKEEGERDDHGGLSLEVLRRIREQDPRERNPWKAMAEVQGAGSSTSIGDVGPDVTRERDVSVGGARFREITRPGFSHRESIGSGAPRFSMKELGTFEDGDCFFPPCNQERGLTDPNKSIDLLIKKRLAESSEQSTNAEIGFWQSVSSSQDPEVLRSYLVRYPDGQFSALAKAKIEGIERFTVEQKIAEARALEERTTSAEIVSWQSVSSSQDPEVVRSYLLQYPDGRFVALAEAKISSLERVAAEQKIVEARLKEERARDVEDGAWREAAISNDLGVVNSYLKSYPEGRYVDLARQQLKFLERSQFGVAVVIGNKNYSSKLIPEVNYAHNDADLFLEVINKNMGYSSENIIDLRDASQAQMLSTFGNEKNHKGKLWSFLDSKGRSDVVIFYSGHGAPGLQDKRGYILPSDSDPNTVEINGYPLELLLKNLSKLEDAKSVTVFLESCFSGVGHSGPLVSAASPVFVKVKEPSPARNVVVVSAASNEQVASWDDRNKVGLFSRYLAEGLTGRADINQDMRVTGQEILDYLDENMTPAARRLFMRQQNAQLIGDPNSILSVLR